MLCNSRSSISSCEVARSLGITQKSAWFMLHRIRKAMHDDTFAKFSGEVEPDETFIGGNANVAGKRLTYNEQPPWALLRHTENRQGRSKR